MITTTPQIAYRDLELTITPMDGYCFYRVDSIHVGGHEATVQEAIEECERLIDYHFEHLI